MRCDRESTLGVCGRCRRNQRSLCQRLWWWQNRSTRRFRGSDGYFRDARGDRRHSKEFTPVLRDGSVNDKNDDAEGKCGSPSEHRQIALLTKVLDIQVDRKGSRPRKEGEAKPLHWSEATQRRFHACPPKSGQAFRIQKDYERGRNDDKDNDIKKSARRKREGGKWSYPEYYEKGAKHRQPRKEIPVRDS